MVIECDFGSVCDVILGSRVVGSALFMLNAWERSSKLGDGNV